MIVITNKDLEILIKIENLIGTKSKELFGVDNDKKVVIKWYDNSETVVNASDFIDYMNIVEKIINDKKKCAEKSNRYNKEHKEYHRIINNICSARKSGNAEKLECWKRKLEDYKKGRC